MNTVLDEFIYEFEEKKSKFIGIIFHIENDSDFNNKLNEIKNKYPKATHYVYAYRLIDSQRMSDDGEPTGTGALPIMNVIEKESLCNVGIVVVRYFGGIKLGAGGLIRAYSKASSNLVNKDNLKVLEPAKEIELIIDYSDINDLDYLINKTGSTLVNKSFDNTIKYLVIVNNKNLDSFSKYKYTIKKDTMIII